MNILVSACLLGVNCRYNGGGELAPGILELMERCHLVPVCPEIMGGLATPRTPAERRDGRVVTGDGQDVTGAYARGAEEAVRLAKLYRCRYALLKERSPSCGSGRIYDGTFTRKLIPGDGVTAARLRDEGVAVYGESAIRQLLSDIERQV
ncbi:MAG: DUF523 domain-containing protein [Enterocloster asparagiformis]|nr:DUF523 domain-containing protein [Enterocloster asparagiformis]